MKRHQQTEVDKKSGHLLAISRKSGFSRTSASYWKNRLERTASPNGSKNPFFSIRIGYKKRRERFTLNSSNKNKAANLAAEIFVFLVGNGWDATLEKFKPQSVPVPAEEKEEANTVGALIEASRKYSTAREQSLNAYIKAFRRIVSLTMNIDHPSRKSRRPDRSQSWQEQVDAVALSELTPSRIQSWKKEFLNTPRAGAQEQRQAITTLNSLIRNAKALFAKKLLPFLEKELQLPHPLPFDQVTMEKSPSVRYRSKIDAKAILAKSHKDLKEDHPETYKIFILALVCGMRVSEIDHLLWTAFDFDENLLRIQDSEFHRLKSEDSAGEIALSQETQDLFFIYSQKATGQFVIEAEQASSPTAFTSRYRCQKHINILKTWLRDQGVTATKPIHELRKEVGSIIASEEGIFAASRYLRHSDIRITSAIYADQKKRVTPSIASSL